MASVSAALALALTPPATLLWRQWPSRGAVQSLGRPWREEALSSVCTPNAPCRAHAGTFWSAPPDDQLFFYTFQAPAFAHKDLALFVAVLERLGTKKDRKMTFVQIGPNELSEEERARWGLVSEVVKNLGGSVYWIFVEPLAAVLPGLMQDLHQIGLQKQEAHVINAAVCTEDAGGISLYKFDDETSRHYPRVRKWSSLAGKEVPIATWRRVWAPIRPDLASKPPQELNAMIEVEPVRCLAPSGLLAEAGIDAGAVDMLIVDAEGYDGEILQSFSSLEDFAPGVLIFEWTHLHAARGKLDLVVQEVRRWASKGYDVHKDHDNIWMFKTT